MKVTDDKGNPVEISSFIPRRCYVIDNSDSYKDLYKLSRYKMSEKIIPGKLAQIVVDAQGNRLVSIVTRDCDSDNLEEYDNAVFDVKDGYYIINAVKIYNHNVYIISVIQEFYQNGTFLIECIYNSDVLDSSKTDIVITKKLSKTIDFVHNLINFKKPNPAFKYSVNPFRTYEIRLFEKERGSFMSFDKSGKSLYLNKKSSEFDLNKRGILMKVFYNKRFTTNESLIVNGYSLIPYSLEEIDEVKTNEDLFKNGETLRYLITKNGFDFLAFNNERTGDLKALYHSPKGISSFILNEYEMKFISKIEKIK